jgi:hypothetical protein
MITNKSVKLLASVGVGAVIYYVNGQTMGPFETSIIALATIGVCILASLLMELS